MNKDEWVQRYERDRPLFVDFTKELSQLLQDVMKPIPHVLQSRTKDIKSFSNKIVRPDKDYARFEQVTDLSASRVLTYTLEEAEKVRQVVERNFNVDWKNTIDKRGNLKPN